MNLLAILAAAAALAFAEPRMRPVPPEAARAIREVTAAAKKRDFAALRRSMIDKFKYSFGGDLDADQAIGRWKEEKRHLTEMVRVLGQPCGLWDYFHVVCPGNDDLGYRAGLRKTPEGWKLDFFVEGD